MSTEPLAIAHVSPFALEANNDVGTQVRRVSEELARRGHRVLIIAPSQSTALVRDSRRVLHDDPGGLLERADGAPVQVAVGGVLPFSPTRRRADSIPVDVARTIEEALITIPLDVVHVHEPFAPSASSVALRHSRSLNVATFHGPTERILSTQIARPLTRLLFARLDARIASYSATRDLMTHFFPGRYTVSTPGADTIPPVPDGDPERAVEVVMIAEEERAALRTFVRALRRMPAEVPWRATIWTQRPLAATPTTLNRVLRERVAFLDAGQTSAAHALVAADAVVLASEGTRSTPWILLSALASGVIPIASRLAPYDELLADGGLRARLRSRRRRNAGRASDLCRARSRTARVAARRRRDGPRAGSASTASRRTTSGPTGSWWSAATIAGDPGRCVARSPPGP